MTRNYAAMAQRGVLAQRRKWKRTFVSRFWARVKIGNAKDCWTWTGSVNESGYGQVKRAGKQWTCHRLAFVLLVRRIPFRKLVLHKCDNPRCVNPEHLFVGTPLDNVLDCEAKGRRRYRTGPSPTTTGVLNPKAKLTEKEVRKIRQMTFNKRGDKARAARRFGITPQNINHVLKSHTWLNI